MKLRLLVDSCLSSAHSAYVIARLLHRIQSELKLVAESSVVSAEKQIKQYFNDLPCFNIDELDFDIDLAHLQYDGIELGGINNQQNDDSKKTLKEKASAKQQLCKQHLIIITELKAQHRSALFILLQQYFCHKNLLRIKLNNSNGQLLLLDRKSMHESNLINTFNQYLELTHDVSKATSTNNCYALLITGQASKSLNTNTLKTNAVDTKAKKTHTRKTKLARLALSHDSALQDLLDTLLEHCEFAQVELIDDTDNRNIKIILDKLLAVMKQQDCLLIYFSSVINLSKHALKHASVISLSMIQNNKSLDFFLALLEYLQAQTESARIILVLDAAYSSADAIDIKTSLLNQAISRSCHANPNLFIFAVLCNLVIDEKVRHTTSQWRLWALAQDLSSCLKTQEIRFTEPLDRAFQHLFKCFQAHCTQVCADSDLDLRLIACKYDFQQQLVFSHQPVNHNTRKNHLLRKTNRVRRNLMQTRRSTARTCRHYDKISHRLIDKQVLRTKVFKQETDEKANIKRVQPGLIQQTNRTSAVMQKKQFDNNNNSAVNTSDKRHHLASRMKTNRNEFFQKKFNWVFAVGLVIIILLVVNFMPPNSDQENAELLYSNAKALVAKQDIANAIKLLSNSIKHSSEHNPVRNKALFLRGFLYFQHNRLRPAVNDFQALIALDPDHRLARYYLGRAYLLDKKPEQAITQFKRIKDSLAFAEVYLLYTQGLGAINNEKQDKAIKFFDKAIAVFTTKINALRLKVFASQHKDFAIDLYRHTAFNQQSSNLLAEIYLRLGHLHLAKKQFDKAIKNYNQAVQLQPDNAVAYINRGLAYSENSRYHLALLDYSKAIEINPKNARAYIARAQVYLAGAKPTSHANQQLALRDFSKAIEVDPSYSRAYIYRSNLYQKLHQLDKAKQDRNRAINIKLEQVMP